MSGTLRSAVASSSRCTLSMTSPPARLPCSSQLQSGFRPRLVAADVNGATMQSPAWQQRTYASKRNKNTVRPQLLKLEENEVDESGKPPSDAMPGQIMDPSQRPTIFTHFKDGDKMPPLQKGTAPDPETQFAHMPAMSQWGSIFKRGSNYLQTYRRFLANEVTADRIVEALDLPGRRARTPNPEQGLTIIEGYAGPGTITRSFLKNDNVESVLALEDNKSSVPWLTSLINDETLEGKGKKLKAIATSAFHWETYTESVQRGLLDNVPAIRDGRGKEPDYSNGVFTDAIWQQESPVLVFVTVPNTVHGEQLFVQFIQAIAHRLWLFRYLRVTLVFVCAEVMAKRCMAEPGSKFRSRISVLTQALGEPKVLLDSSHFSPTSDHFWPDGDSIGPRLLTVRHAATLIRANMSSGITKVDQCLFAIEPLKTPLVSGIDAEAFEFVTRHLFILKSQPVEKALQHMAPGAVSLLDKLNEGTHPAMRGMEHIKIDPSTPVQNLTALQFAALSRIFERWPFRPEILFEEERIAKYKATRVFSA